MIRITGLKKGYGRGATAVTALDTINLTVNKGDIHGIIGMSGAGKSTLIRCVNRLDTPTEGSIEIDGQDILAMNPRQLRATRRRVSMIFQHFNLMMQKTVARNIRYPLEIAGVPKAQANQRVMELLKIVGLEDKVNERASSLPYGHQRKLEIARAMALDPKLLLLDEPAAGMNTEESLELVEFVREIRNRFDITILMIEHHMDVVTNLCDYCTVLNFGKTIAVGTPAEVKSNPEVIKAYLGGTD